MHSSLFPVISVAVKHNLQSDWRLDVSPPPLTTCTSSVMMSDEGPRARVTSGDGELEHCGVVCCSAADRTRPTRLEMDHAGGAPVGKGSLVPRFPPATGCLYSC